MRGWFRTILFLTGAIAFAADTTTTPSDDGINELFDATPKDVIADTVAKPNDATLLTSPTKFSGAVIASFGALSDNRSASGFYSMETDFTVDSRPSPVFRIYGTAKTLLSGAGFSTPTFDNLFIDYIIAETVVIRAGKQVLSWGQGRIFNPGDLVSDSNNGASIKVFTPFFGQNLTGVVIGDPSKFQDPLAPSWRELVYTAQLSGDLGPVSWGFAGRAVPGRAGLTPDHAGSTFLKTVLWGADVFGEGIVDQDGPHFLTGFYWEGGDPVWKIRGELTDSRVGAALKWSRSDVSPLVEWQHSRTDGSGNLTTGVEFYPVPLVTVTLGVPWTYGRTNSEYYELNQDPAKRWWSLGLKAELSASF